MKLKNMWKRFWTLDVHNHEGFTLVELIIVIAILAILSTGAIAGYSAYVTSANKTADQALAAEVANVLMLAHYSNSIDGSGYVVLGLEGEATATENLYQVLEDAFGSHWRTALRLKYNDWNVAYTDSPFQGNETALITRVESITDALSDTLAEHPELVGEGFRGYMTSELGFSADDLGNQSKVADAAVLYVANGTSNLSPEQQEQFKSVVTTSGGDFETMLNGLIPVYGSNVMAAAATYAMLVSWCQYEDKLNNNTELMDRLGTFDGMDVDANDPQQLVDAIMGTMDEVGQYMDEQAALGEDGVQFHAEEYFTNQVTSAVDGFINVMGTANSAKNHVNLGSADCFDNAELRALFSRYGEGSVVILVETLNDGSVRITNPLAE